MVIKLLPSQERAVPGCSVPSNTTRPSTVTRNQHSLKIWRDSASREVCVGVALGEGAGLGLLVALAGVAPAAAVLAVAGAAADAVAAGDGTAVGDGGRVGIGVTVGIVTAGAETGSVVGAGVGAKMFAVLAAVNRLYWWKI